MNNIHYLTSKTLPPMQHQTDCFFKLYNHEYAGIFGEQGTGKSRMLIDIVSNHFAEGHINAVLLIAPKGVHQQWKDEQVPIHSPIDVVSFLWNSSGGKAYRYHMKKFVELKAPTKLKWFFVNVDTFSTDRHIPFLREFVKLHNTAIVIDESTRIKNHTANRTHNIVYNLAALRKEGRAIKQVVPYAKYRYVLTGMQVTDSPYDLWAPFSFLKYDFFGMNFYAFKAKYGIEVIDRNKQTGQRYPRKISPTEIQSILKYYQQGFDIEQVSNILGIGESNVGYIIAHPNIRFPYKHLEELKTKIEPYTFTIRKEECMDLPEKIYEKIIVEMSMPQKRVYNDLKNKMIAEYSDKELTVTSKLALLVRLQQITSGFFPYETAEFDTKEEVWKTNTDIIPIGTKNPKIEAIKGQIDELGNAKIFIAAKFIAEIKLLHDQLAKAYPDKNIAMYYGAISDKDRKIAKEGFQSGEIDILIMNVRMALGFNFQETCHNAMAISGTYSLEDRKQWEDRIHRIGQKMPVLYQDYIMKGTVDEKIYAAIKFKEDLLDFFRDKSIVEFIQ